MMYSMNSWSCLWALIGILITGELAPTISFLQNYPYVIPRILLLGITGAIGQVNLTPWISADACLMSVD